MKKKTVLISFLFLTLLLKEVNVFAAPCPIGEEVRIVSKETHFEVLINYKTGISPRKMGELYACAILKAIPDYPFLVDSYLKDLMENPIRYFYLLNRASSIKKNLNPFYLEEMEGLTSVLSKGVLNFMGDGKISADELLLLNLLPDVGRASQCSVLSLFGEKTETGSSLIGRALDWRSGGKRQITRLQAFITIQYPERYIYSIGYIGFMGIITGFNSDGIFAAILDAATGKAFPFLNGNNQSYPLDLRFALEKFNSIQKIADFMKIREYSFNHLIFLADKKEGKTLENNLDRNRTLRSADSDLNNGVKWEFKDSLASVNCFMLKGNFNNFSGIGLNTKRWDVFRAFLKKKKVKWVFDDLKEVFSFYHGRIPGSLADGDIFNKRTQQIILFDPARMRLEVFFAPKQNQVLKPFFEKISVITP